MVETYVTASFGVSLSAKKNLKIAFLTGISGQIGSYLAEFLLNKGYEVHGLMRRSATPNTKNIDHILDKLKLHYGDLTDAESLDNIIYEVQPDEVYHLGAMSHVRISFDIPVYTADVVALGTLRLLESIRRFSPGTKFLNMHTSESFGSALAPQDENTPMHPNNPYGISKLFSFENTRLYRQSYGMFACSSITFNSESPRRGDDFVTQKIVKGLINCAKGKQEKLYLGNLDAKRDWGYAGDTAEGLWLILQQPIPDDFCLGTGMSYTIRDFLDLVGKYVKIEWRNVVEIDSNFYRPTETSYLLANPKKAQEKLGWKSKTSLEELVVMMVDAEFARKEEKR